MFKMDSEEDKLMLNGLMFYHIREKKTSQEKIENIKKILEQGADVNFADNNNKKNTILHIAAQKDEKDIVEFLLQKGALLSYNIDNRTPIHIAKDKNTDVSKEIVKILTKNGKYATVIDDKSSTKSSDNQVTSTQSQSTVEGTENKDIFYPKRAGTSGGSGQFYETKLLSLVHHRAIHDRNIEECYLAANIRDVGDFDDVCFRFKIFEDGEAKHVMSFTQAKHREDVDKAKLTVASIRSSSGNLSLVKYYDSFLKIKQQFYTKLKDEDPMFSGRFSDIDCYFILYTPLKESFERKLKDNKQVCSTLHKIMYTGDKQEVFRFNYEERDIEYLTNFIQKDRIKILGKVFLSFILTNAADMMTNDLIQIFHPALAREVVTQRLNSSKYKFRDDFFYSDEPLLIILKEALYKEIVYTRNKKTELTKEEVKARVKEITKKPCAETISMLIGEVIYFDDKTNKLNLDVDKISRKKYKQEDIREIVHELQKIPVTLAMIKEAVDITGKAKLKLLDFTLPYTFGNMDIPSNQANNELPLKRIIFFAEKFHALMEEKKKKVEIDRAKNNVTGIKYPIEIEINDDIVGPKNILEYSHLNTKGIGGTVGNFLQFDTENQVFKINTNEESLKINARNLLKQLKTLTQDNLDNFVFNVKMFNFPRSSFEVNQFDKSLAKEFLEKLWFYTNQANEESVEKILKKEIDKHYNSEKQENQFLFRVHTDAIFLRYHDEIQKWWKAQTQARYLTKTDPIFDDAKKDVIDTPVLTVLNVMFIRALNKFHVEFSVDVLKSLNFDNILEKNNVLNLISGATILSAAKIMQSIKQNQYKTKYTFINLDYVHLLPNIDYSTMMEELKAMKEVTLVIISETTINHQLKDTLLKIIITFNGKIILITDTPLQIQSTKQHQIVVVEDKNISLSDLNLKSQSKILKDCKINYQGKTITLDTIINENAKYLIDAKLLWNILIKNVVEIGNVLNSVKYDEIKEYYITRSLFLDGEEFEVNTFNDIEDQIVLITSKPCMGKTILLTHLSLETKNIYPQFWIVPFNLSAYSNDFVEWQNNAINVTSMMRFLCKAALKKTDQIRNLNFYENEDKTVVVTSDVDLTFELKLFIHLYNIGKVIFLFDGFERIYPHHTNEGMELFKALKEANKRMWLTSSTYVINILQSEFGPSYKLDKLTPIQQESFLTRFFKTNLKLENLSHEQYNNVKLFINYLLKTFNAKDNLVEDDRPVISLLSIPLHIVYLTAMNYFKNEINTISPKYLRETIKQKWGLNRLTAVDRYLREPEEEESLDLAGTPLHMYVAANYFNVQIKEKFELSINEKVILNKANMYLNTLTSYERFLKANMKLVCDVENKNNKTFEQSQEQARDNFFEIHKNLALFAIFKDDDIEKVLPEPKIREVKNIIQSIEAGDSSSPLIDCVIDGVPRFYNLLFVEYFLVEFATDLCKQGLVNQNPQNINLESMWDFIVNAIIMICPPGVRNAFNYKLKYDPELAEIASNENCSKIIFDLIVKQNHRAKISGNSTESALNLAINEGLVNITNLFLKCSSRYVDRDNVDGFVSGLKTGAFVLGAANPSWKDLTDKVFHCIREVDGDMLLQILKSEKLEDVSRSLTDLCASTSFGQDLHQRIRNDVCEPIRRATDIVLEHSSHNENLMTLMEILPHHLPDIVNFLFGKK